MQSLRAPGFVYLSVYNLHCRDKTVCLFFPSALIALYVILQFGL